MSVSGHIHDCGVCCLSMSSGHSRHHFSVSMFEHFFWTPLRNMASIVLEDVLCVHSFCFLSLVFLCCVCLCDHNCVHVERFVCLLMVVSDC